MITLCLAGQWGLASLLPEELVARAAATPIGV